MTDATISPCRTCKAAITSPCVFISGTKRGEVRTVLGPHQDRIADAGLIATAYAKQFDAGAESRQGEMDAMKASLAADVASIKLLQTSLSNAQSAAAMWEQEYDDLVPLAKRVKTRFGACPRKGRAADDVVSRWGAGAAVRIFAGQLGTAVERPVGAGVVHISWKEFDLVDAADAAKVNESCVNLRAGDGVELIHESDNDGLTATEVAARIELKNTFFDTVRRVRPDLLVVHTMTGWIYEPKSKLNPFVWAGKVKADVLAMDCDGIRPTKLPYTDYTDETRRILDIIADPANHYSLFAVPEFGCPRIPTLDPDGAIHAAYNDFYAFGWASTGKCAWVTLYEYDSSPNYALVTPAQINGWKSHV